MSFALEISSKNYVDDKLAIKLALSHLETLVGCQNGYVLSEPYAKFGWTFFKIALKADLQIGIEHKFADMLATYRRGNQGDKITLFMADYFKSKGCDVKIKPVS